VATERKREEETKVSNGIVCQWFWPSLHRTNTPLWEYMTISVIDGDQALAGTPRQPELRFADVSM
jgi:hypothetical protein